VYRLLELGEVIEEGDEWYEEGAWQANNVFGLKYMIDTPLRRLIKPDVTPAAPSVPDPGEGYRLLADHEIIDRHDEVNAGCGWIQVASSLYSTPGKSRNDYYEFKGVQWRRRIPQPDPVVSVGDRVTVLSGTWAGCTGVVTGFDYPQGGTVKLDHVHVGGTQLTVVSQVEKLPPVVPEVVYRNLAIGEVIRKGDEFLSGFDCWLPVVSIGAKWNYPDFQPMRRPVRVQSPGWRYLDAGETVQAGDEHRFFGPWELCGSSVGKVTTEADGRTGQIRRKLPANVGG